jgi:hypothetical protein
MHTPSYLLKNSFGIYHLRLAVPKRFRELFGKRDIKRSLRTGNHRETLRKARLLKTFVGTDGQTVRYSPETLRKWLYRYRHGGLPALSDAPRSTLGRHDAVPEDLAERIVELRTEHPRWTLARILAQLIEERRWNMVNPSRATLYRFALSRNLQRDPHLAPLPAQAFAYQDFGQLWSADFLHGPKIKIKGVKRKTYLHAIIDDATRYIVRSHFFLAEDTEVMIKELMAAITTHGKPLRFYTDNGACYASHHLKFACANLTPLPANPGDAARLNVSSAPCENSSSTVTPQSPIPSTASTRPMPSGSGSTITRCTAVSASLPWPVA